jgi:uncharacterized protein (TIGR03067 family)
MQLRVAVIVGALLVVPALALSQEGTKTREEDARKELLKFQGTWQFQSWEDGSKKPPAKLAKRTFFVGGPVFIVREGNKVIQAGTLRVAPWKFPRTIDAVVKKGPHEGNTMLGLYQIDGDILKVCFDPEGDARPKKFGTKEGTPLFVAVYKRVRRPGETIDIIGKYKAEPVGVEGPAPAVVAEIQRQGDAYTVTWRVGKAVAYVGIGIRKGNTLSVAWTNRGQLGVSVYEIHKGPRLFGTYTEITGAGLMARENLTPYEDPKERSAQAPAKGGPDAGTVLRIKDVPRAR